MTIAEIAEQTKIKASLLEGLERDDVSQWPSGIFRRAYVRSYATAIGFDADAAVREFLTLYPEPVEPVDPPAPPRGLRGLVASALGSLRKAPTVEPTTGEVAAAAPTIERPAPPFVLEKRAPACVMEKPAPPPAMQKPAAAMADKPVPLPAPARAADDLLAAAKICTELGRVEETGQVPPLLRDAAKVLNARGLIVWVWDAVAEQLRPAFVHGYAAKVRAKLRGVRPDADNVTAAAFRASAPLAKAGDGGTSGALAVPMLTPSGCGGVLAIEVAAGLEQDPVVRALATFFAAMLAQLVAAGQPEAASEPQAAVPALEAHPG